jgi:hypothetical protein
LKAYVRQPLSATVHQARAKRAELTGITRSPTQVRVFRKWCGRRCRQSGGLPAYPRSRPRIKKRVGPSARRDAGGNPSGRLRRRRPLRLGACVSALGCFARVWIQEPRGRRRFHVLGALQALTPEVIIVTHPTYLHAQSLCPWLPRLAALAQSGLIPGVLDNTRYQRCVLVQAGAEPLPIELLFVPPVEVGQKAVHVRQVLP